MAVKIDTTIRTSAIVTNAKGGFVKMARAIGESDIFKSATFNKYSDNDLLELIFRVSTSVSPPSRQLVRVTKLDVSDRFYVILTGVSSTSPSAAYDASLFLCEKLSLPEDSLQELQNLIEAGMQPDAEMSINLQEGMLYDDAWVLRDELSEMTAGNMTFEVVKHTAENMPDKVASYSGQIAAELEWVGSHWIPPQNRLMFQVALETIQNGRIKNMLLKGESGYGKTSTFKAIAEWLNIPCVYINCASLQDTEQWFGYSEARDGSTVFDPSEFAQACQAGNTLIILDEFNRIEPWLHNSLLPILDHRRETSIHGVQINVAPGTLFCATINEGARYAGTNTIDAATYNRFDMVSEVAAPPPHVEVDIMLKKFPGILKANHSKVISMVNELRNSAGSFGMSVDISTRSVEKMAGLISDGLSLRQAAQYVIIFTAQVDERKALLDVVNMKLGTDPLFS